MKHTMEKESNKMQPEPVWPLIPYEYLPPFHATSQEECSNSSDDCSMESDELEPIISSNEHQTFNDALKDAILRDYEFLDSYTAIKEKNFNIFNSVDHKTNISDNSNFDVRPLQPHIDEKESNNGKLEQLVRPMLPSQCLTSFDTTPSVTCNTEEIFSQRVYDYDLLKDVIVQEDEVLNPFTATIANYFVNIYKYIDPNVRGKANVFDNSNLSADSSTHSSQSTTFEQVQHEMHSQGNATATDIDYNLCPEDSNAGIEVHTNQIPLIEEDKCLITVCSRPSLLPINDVIESTVCLQDAPKETSDGESYDEHNKTLQEYDDASDSNDKENFEIVNSHDECEKESIQSPDIQSRTLNVLNDKNSTFKTEKTHKDEKPYVCETCNKSFKQKRCFIRHVRDSYLHTGEKPHMCNLCDKSFRNRSSLLDHIRVHTGEKPFVCETCKQSFRNLPALQYHSFIHTGKKPYVCNVCQATFRQKNTLLSHSNTHKDKKPYVCNVCQKAFAQRNSLQYHSYTHTGKPFVCNVCQKAFSQYTALRNHSYRHTGESPYKCKVCGKSFTVSRNLILHSRVHISKKLD